MRRLPLLFCLKRGASVSSNTVLLGREAYNKVE